MLPPDKAAPRYLVTAGLGRYDNNTVTGRPPIGCLYDRVGSKIVHSLFVATSANVNLSNLDEIDNLVVQHLDIHIAMERMRGCLVTRHVANVCLWLYHGVNAPNHLEPVLDTLSNKPTTYV